VKPFDARALVDLINRMAYQEGNLLGLKLSAVQVAIPADAFEPLIKGVEALSDYGKDVGLPLSARSAKEALETLRIIEKRVVDTSNIRTPPNEHPPSVRLYPVPDTLVAQLIFRLQQIAGRLIDELDAAAYLYLSPIEMSLYLQDAPLFGAEVSAKFPSLAYEVSEGGKCLGLERSTAAAFHFIRCLEGGIAAMSRCLGIADPTKGHERNWNKMLEKIRDSISTKWPGSTINDDKQFFQTAHAALAAIQNPYRNATMHLDQKYTPDEARHIMEMVGGFMKKLAARMDENGSPAV
jgi:hypothetical protein